MWYSSGGFDSANICRTDSRCVTSQLETVLLYNEVSHWLGARLELALIGVLCCYEPLQVGFIQLYNEPRFQYCNTNQMCLIPYGDAIYIRDGVSNHRDSECLFNRLFRRRSTKTSKLRVTGLCEFPAQRASYAENVSIWWRHHVSKEPRLQYWNTNKMCLIHYGDAIMSTMASQIIGIAIVCSTVSSGADQRKHQSPTSLVFVKGNPPVTGEFPSQGTSNAFFSVWWSHHVFGENNTICSLFYHILSLCFTWAVPGETNYFFPWKLHVRNY